MSANPTIRTIINKEKTVIRGNGRERGRTNHEQVEAENEMLQLPQKKGSSPRAFRD